MTADDDIYYRPNWLATLVNAYTGNDQEILCWRAHYLRRATSGEIRPYRQWYPKTEVRGPDPRLFFTSGAGVLFPPGCFDKREDGGNDAQLQNLIAHFGLPPTLEKK
ncbi:hypothetical protein [Idiomarina sp. ST10R2A5]|uniref:hypothetical protein n=1 Tax=Idiomarina sp. ST10R2A5 TaxID=3418368 RepID=UPI003EC6EB84